ncbi:hypothetical protein PG995_001972 [Apiospora arundinis]
MTAALEPESRSEAARDSDKPGQDAAGDSKWAQAVQSLSDDDREQFGIAQSSADQDPLRLLEDILAATEAKKAESLDKRWKVTVKGRKIIVRDVLEKMALWVNKFMAIGSMAVQYDPTSAALPWAAIKLIMQAAVNDVEIFAYSLTALEKITNMIGRSQVFEQLYLSRQSVPIQDSLFRQLSASVTKLYAAILQYLARVLRYYRTGTVIRFLKSAAKSKTDLESDFRRLEEAQVETLRLAQLAEAHKSEALAFSIAELSEKQSQIDQDNTSRLNKLRDILQGLDRPISRISAQLGKIQDELDQESRYKILRAISTISYATHHKVAFQGRLRGSGKWFLDKSVYVAWRESSCSSVLWLHGVPGSGKTKLASLVVDDLKPTEHIAYFYCMRNPSEPLRALGQSILASLVRQLASVDPSKPLLSPIVSQYQSALDGYEGFEDQSWTVDDCRSVLLDLLDEYPAVTIIIDALDEVDGEGRQELMDILSELLQDSNSLVKVFISSRDSADIALSLEGSPNVYIEAEDNTLDVETFITDRLAKAKLLHGKLPDTLHTEISDTLLSGAKGMFRWVELQIQSLRRLKVAADIKAQLGRLPETLEGAYWEVYQQILASGENAAKLAVFTFQWLLYAQYTIPIDSFSKFASLALSDDPDVVYSSNEIVDVCANFVVSRRRSFHFAHLSVREFLEHLPKRQVTTVITEVGHMAVARACLLHLGAVASAVNKCGFDPLSYRYKNLVKTMVTTGELPSSELDFEDELEEYSGPGTVETSSKKGNPDQDTPLPSDQAVESTTGELGMQAHRAGENDKAEDTAISNGGEEDDFDRPERSTVLATRYAVAFWIHHVKASGKSRTENLLGGLLRHFLVDSNKRIVAPGFTVWCHLAESQAERFDYSVRDITAEPPNPLWLVCLHDWPEFVETLYEANYPDMESRRIIHQSFDISPLESLMSPLLYAVTAGHSKLIQTLVRCRSKVPSTLQFANSQEENTTSRTEPLFRATTLKNAELALDLLGNGYSNMEDLASSFIRAASDGTLELLKLFLQHGADVQALGYQSLLGVCESGSSIGLSFLLEHGCRTEPGEPLLICAAYNGQAHVLRTLLEHGVGLENIRDPFALAVASGHDNLVPIFAKYNPRKEPVAVVKQIIHDAENAALNLIQAGWEIHGRYLERRRTALHYAAEKGHAKVVAALLEREVAVDIFDRGRNTPLHLAAMSGRDQCVDLLLAHGADVLAEDRDGNIALDLAAKYHHSSTESIVRRQMERMVEELQTKTNEIGDRPNSTGTIAVEDDGGIACRGE